jgi:hypothetical protein
MHSRLESNSELVDIFCSRTYRQPLFCQLMIVALRLRTNKNPELNLPESQRMVALRLNVFRPYEAGSLLDRNERTAPGPDAGTLRTHLIIVASPSTARE